MVIGGFVDLAGGGANKRSKSAADKLIQGVRQGTEAELAGIDAARASQLGSTVNAGLLNRRGLTDALAFLGGPTPGPMTPGQFGVDPRSVDAEFLRRAGTPFKVFGEDNEQSLFDPATGEFLGGIDPTGGTLGDIQMVRDPATGMFVPHDTMATTQPVNAPGGVFTRGPTTGGMPGVPGGGLLGAVREPFQPFVEAGQEAVGALRNPVAEFMNDPAVQFRLQQGQQAIERSAASRGGLVSGNTLQDVNQFAQGVASEEFNNSFNRALATAGLGLGAAGTQAGLTSDVGNRIVQALLGVGATESDIAEQVGNITAGSTLSAAQSIAQREKLLGEIKAGKKASQLTTGEQINQAINPLVGTALGATAAFGLPGVGGAGVNQFQGRPLSPAEQLIASFGVRE